MILDEHEIIDQQDQEYESYLKLIQYWGYVILLGGITSLIAIIYIYTKVFATISSFSIIIESPKYLCLIPVSIMPFAAFISGWRLIKNHQSKGFFWLKTFWALSIITFVILFFTFDS